MVRQLLGALLLSAAVGGCATYPEEQGNEFGSSVRHMIEAQTYAPVDQVPRLHGDKAAATMDAYRSDVAKPEDVSKDLIKIQVGE